ERVSLLAYAVRGRGKACREANVRAHGVLESRHVLRQAAEVGVRRLEAPAWRAGASRADAEAGRFERAPALAVVAEERDPVHRAGPSAIAAGADGDTTPRARRVAGRRSRE